MNYQSPLPYEASRLRAAAVYCSDGRVGEHFDDFLHQGLKLPRYDRVALPGGPGCLAGHTEARLEQEGVIGELQFLVEAHDVQKVVLIQHDACAFYAQRIRVEPERMPSLQRADLVRAAFQIRRVCSKLEILAFQARLVNGAMTFAQIEID